MVHNNPSQSSFPLIFHFIVKLAELTLFDKTNHACGCMELVNIGGELAEH